MIARTFLASVSSAVLALEASLASCFCSRMSTNTGAEGQRHQGCRAELLHPLLDVSRKLTSRPRANKKLGNTFLKDQATRGWGRNAIKSHDRM